MKLTFTFILGGVYASMWWAASVFGYGPDLGPLWIIPSLVTGVGLIILGLVSSND